jgi:hypothetical protein
MGFVLTDYENIDSHKITSVGMMKMLRDKGSSSPYYVYSVILSLKNL